MTRTAVWQSGPWDRSRGRRWWNWAIKRGWCLCGHHRDAHRHHTVPGDARCGLCACPKFRRSRR